MYFVFKPTSWPPRRLPPIHQSPKLPSFLLGQFGGMFLDMLDASEYMDNQLLFIYIKSLVRYVLLRKCSSAESFNVETINFTRNFSYFCSRDSLLYI